MEGEMENKPTGGGRRLGGRQGGRGAERGGEGGVGVKPGVIKFFKFSNHRTVRAVEVGIIHTGFGVKGASKDFGAPPFPRAPGPTEAEIATSNRSVELFEVCQNETPP